MCVEKLKKKEYTYFVRAEEKYTSYQISIYKVKASSEKEAKQKVLDHASNIEHIESYDTYSENYEYINIDQWEIAEKK